MYAAPFREKDNSTRIPGSNGWYVPQVNGPPQWLDFKEANFLLEKWQQQETKGFSLNPVHYYLYTRLNKQKPQIIKETDKSIEKSNFNAEHPTRFVIHGWFQSYLFPMNIEIRDAWLSRGDYNIIVVDWPRARSLEYISSVLAVPGAGAKVAKMIDYLVKKHNISLDTLHIIGHSLGAHVAGYTGKSIKTNGQVHTIIGLDPASPFFLYKNPKTRLSSTDAFYVESIQTNGNTLGFLQPIGKGAFYPNGGGNQPGCPLDVTGVCSHNLSPTYYAEAVRMNNFVAYKCDTYREAVARNCTAPHINVRMGSISNAQSVAGIYYVPVNKKSPFGTLK